MFGSCFMFPQLCFSHVTQHADTAAGASIWAADVPAWISAIAATGLLIGAYFTARYAAKALRKQSEQMKDQRRINAEQTKVLELQAAELRESLTQRKIAQASQVFIWTETTGEPLIDGLRRKIAPGVAIIAHLKNTSQQPVYDLHIVWRKLEAAWEEPDFIGPFLMPGEQAERMRIIDPNYPGQENIALSGQWPTSATPLDGTGEPTQTGRPQTSRRNGKEAEPRAKPKAAPPLPLWPH